MALSPLEQGAVPTVVDWVEKVTEGRLEPVSDLILVGRQWKVRRNDRQDRHHPIVGDCAIWIYGADDSHLGGIHQQFFLGLANRGPYCVLSRIDAAARKGNLAGMGSQVLTPNRQHDARIFPIGDRDQHRGGHPCCGIVLDHVADEQFAMRLRSQRKANPISQLHARHPG